MKQINEFIKKCDLTLQHLYSERDRIQFNIDEEYDFINKVKMSKTLTGVKETIRAVKQIQYDAINLQSEEFENNSFDAEVSSAVIKTIPVQKDIIRDVDPIGYYNMRLSELEHLLATVENVKI